MSNQASNADKENSMIKERRSIKECLSPETQQCVDLLMGMKNSASKPRYSSKRTPVVFTENVGVNSNLWPPKITSPLHVVVPLTNATSFTFGDSEVGSCPPLSTAEVISASNTNSLTSYSSLSSHSSVKRSDSNDAYYPQRKYQHSEHMNMLSFNSLLSAATSQDRRDDAKVTEDIKDNKDTHKDTKTNPRRFDVSLDSGCVTCNCKKSRCLKLYCECFKNQEYCSSECNCLNCYNNHKHEEEREETIQRMKAKNPHCFDDHVDKKKGVNRSGCRCRRTHCDKKYCECFSSGVPCGDQCQCKDCKNQYGHL